MGRFLWMVAARWVFVSCLLYGGLVAVLAIQRIYGAELLAVVVGIGVPYGVAVAVLALVRGSGHADAVRSAVGICVCGAGDGSGWSLVGDEGHAVQLDDSDRGRLDLRDNGDRDRCWHADSGGLPGGTVSGLLDRDRQRSPDSGVGGAGLADLAVLGLRAVSGEYLAQDERGCSGHLGSPGVDRDNDSDGDCYCIAHRESDDVGPYRDCDGLSDDVSDEFGPDAGAADDDGDGDLDGHGDGGRVGGESVGGFHGGSGRGVDRPGVAGRGAVGRVPETWVTP